MEHHMLLMKPFLIEPNAVADELGNRRDIKGHHHPHINSENSPDTFNLLLS